MKTIPFFLLFFLLSSCASKPVLYPNKKLKSVGKEASYKDIKKCQKEADEFLDSPKVKKILKSAGRGATGGGAVGAITGLLSGDILRGLIFGSAIGATAGGVGEALSPDQIERRYVNRCLQKKGYEVIGWD